jgi:hypothetical protein
MTARQEDFGKPGDPDLFVADLHVYRLMGWGDLGPYLHGVHRADRWSADYRAECMKWPRDHEGVAHPDCSCGIYGWYKPDRDWETGGRAFAVVRLSGRAVLGSLGVRAERAQILAVAYVKPCDCGCSDNTETEKAFGEAMSAYYPGVALYPSRAALLEDFPPSDWESIVGPIEEPKAGPAVDFWRSIGSLTAYYRAITHAAQAAQYTFTPTYYPSVPSTMTVAGVNELWQLSQTVAPKPEPPKDPLNAALAAANSSPTDAVDAGETRIRVGLPVEVRTAIDARIGRSTGPKRAPFRRGGKG